MTNDVVIQETVVFVTVACLIGFLVWMLFRRRQLMSNLEYHRLETLNKMIDKYGSSTEFISFMQTEAGKRLLIQEKPNTQSTNGKSIVLRFLQAAVMIFVLGAGFMAGSSPYGDSTDPNNIQQVHDMQYWGVMCFMLAIGLGIVSLVTYGWYKSEERAARKTRQISQS